MSLASPIKFGVFTLTLSGVAMLSAETHAIVAKGEMLHMVTAILREQVVLLNRCNCEPNLDQQTHLRLLNSQIQKIEAAIERLQRSATPRQLNATATPVRLAD